jgi:glucans biosynthesis protein C
MRRYDLDWLRVLVFGLLIFYHVGMFFVPWGFHIKNNVIYDWLRWPMLFLNQWRLPILFVISGMGTYYALSKRTGGEFAAERIKRLLIPLVAGMLLVVPPQVYFERLAQGQFSGGYFAFWPSEAFRGVYPEGNLSWHHLWFLPYLLMYSLLLTPVLIYLRRHPVNGFIQWIRRRVASPYGIYLFIVPLYFIEALVEPFFPVTHALVDDWFTFINFLVLFFYGFLLISVKETFWHTVQRYRRSYLFAGLIGFTALLGIWLRLEDSTPVHFTEALVKVFNLWSWILAIFGYAATYLTRNSRFLAYSNEAVYPFYILHQTITIAAGYYLMNLDWNFWTKASLMVVATFAGSFVLYEFLIRRWKLLRPLFGLKIRKAPAEKTARDTRPVAS